LASAGLDAFQALLAGDADLVFHNAQYDLLVLAEASALAGVDIMPDIVDALGAGRILDTMLREQLIAIATDQLRTAKRGHFTLAGLAQRYLDHTMIGKGPDDWRLRYHLLDGVPVDQWPDAASEYARLDAELTWRVCEAQGGAVPDEVTQVRASVAFALMAAWGVRTDPARVAALDDRVAAAVADAQSVGVAAGFIRDTSGVAAADPDAKRGKVGSKSMAALRALVVAHHPNPPRTAKGAVSTSRDTLLATGHKGLMSYARAGTELTLARTYLPILRDAAGPITSRPHTLVASGRASWRQPNWTNPPRSGGFRECIVPRPGHVFVTADFGAAEFRALGQICLWEGFGRTIVDAFIAGIDVHLDFAADLLGLTYGAAVAALANDDQRVADARQLAKAANFGFPGGMGAARFMQACHAQGIDIDLPRAYQLSQAFRRKWPEVQHYFRWNGDRCNAADTVTTRQYVSGRVRGGLTYCNLCNTHFQGLVADGAKAAAWDLTKAVRGDGPLRGCRPVLYLHDELIIEAPVGDARGLDARALAEVAAALSDVMVTAMSRYMPDVPVEAEAAAMLRWRKGPKPRWANDGGMLPCDWPDDGVLL